MFPVDIFLCILTLSVSVFVCLPHGGAGIVVCLLHSDVGGYLEVGRNSFNIPNTGYEYNNLLYFLLYFLKQRKIKINFISSPASHLGYGIIIDRFTF